MSEQFGLYVSLCINKKVKDTSPKGLCPDTVIDEFLNVYSI
jgi:hypothetical protein